MRFDYDQGDIHKTYAAGRVLNSAQRAVWTAVIREEVGARPVRCALDLGCGVGRMTPIVREALGAPVVGMDLSERMLAAAVADPATRGARWIRASANAIPLRRESVDLIWMFLVFHHLADGLSVLRECARVLAEGASLIIVNSTLSSLTRSSREASRSSGASPRARIAASPSWTRSTCSPYAASSPASRPGQAHSARFHLTAWASGNDLPPVGLSSADPAAHIGSLVRGR